jgi:hypothetical protein
MMRAISLLFHTYSPQANRWLFLSLPSLGSRAKRRAVFPTALELHQPHPLFASLTMKKMMYLNLQKCSGVIKELKRNTVMN